MEEYRDPGQVRGDFYRTNRNFLFYEGEFNNDPDTDWSLAANRKWAESIRDKWKKGPEDKPEEIPIVVAGKEIFSDRDTGESMDSSQAKENICIAKYALQTRQMQMKLWLLPRLIQMGGGIKAMRNAMKYFPKWQWNCVVPGVI